MILKSNRIQELFYKSLYAKISLTKVILKSIIRIKSIV